MSPETYQRVWEIFDAGVDLDAPGRNTLFDERCGSDLELRRHVEALWANDSGHTAIASELNPEAIEDRLKDELCGVRLGDYQVLERIGSGGMGAVYLAKDVQLDRLAALKFPAPHLVGDPEFRERFLREAKAAAALEHPNICTVYGLGEHLGRPFISMAFLKGRTVEELIRSGPLPIQNSLAIALKREPGWRRARQRDRPSGRETGQSFSHRRWVPASHRTPAWWPTPSPPRPTRSTARTSTYSSWVAARLCDWRGPPRPSSAPLGRPTDRRSPSCGRNRANIMICLWFPRWEASSGDWDNCVRRSLDSSLECPSH